jgi:ParB-like chromosome segregation protein Spo0J
VNLNECKPSELKSDPTLRGLFARSDAMLAKIAESMAKDGFDAAFPIVTWNSIVVDGYTRLQAARKAGLRHVYYVDHQFPDADAALRYAIHCQRDRRNLSEAEILRCVQELDKRKTKAEAGAMAHEQTAGAASSGPSSEETAAAIGTSSTKVEKARTVLDHATPEVRAAVDAGDLSINAAYNATQAARKPPAPEPEPEAPPKPVDKLADYTHQLWLVGSAKPKGEWPIVAAAMRAVAERLDANA